MLYKEEYWVLVIFSYYEKVSSPVEYSVYNAKMLCTFAIAGNILLVQLCTIWDSELLTFVDALSFPCSKAELRPQCALF